MADNRVNAQFADNRQVWIDNRVIQHMDVAALQNMLNGLLLQQSQAQQANDNALQTYFSQPASMVQAHLQEVVKAQQELNKVRDQSAREQSQAQAALMQQQQQTHAAEQEALRAKQAQEAQAALAQAQQIPPRFNTTPMLC